MINKRKFITSVACVLPVLFAIAMVTATGAAAQVVGGGTDPTSILTAISTYILGPFGQALAILACIGVGVTFMFGRLGMMHLGGFVAGLAIIFGSAFLVQQFLGGAT